MLNLILRLSQSYEANVDYHAGLNRRRRSVAGRPVGWTDSSGEYCAPTPADLAPTTDDFGVPY